MHTTTTTRTATTQDQTFAQRMISLLDEAGTALMVSVGHRCGLFAEMEGGGWLSPEAIAAASGSRESLITDWLDCMHAAGIVLRDAESGRYRLPQEHAQVLLATGNSPVGAQAMQQVAMLGSVESLVADAFRHGCGVHPREYIRFHAIAGELNGRFKDGGFERILAQQPGLVRRLERGCIVLEAGCGSGELLTELARRFPRSRFLGIDISPDAIALARRSQLRAGCTNLHFEQRNVLSGLQDDRYDLVIACGLAGTAANPQELLATLHRCMSVDGTLLLGELQLPSHDSTSAPSPWGFAYNCMVNNMHAMAMGGQGSPAVDSFHKITSGLRSTGMREIRQLSEGPDMHGSWISARAGIPREPRSALASQSVRSFHTMPV